MRIGAYVCIDLLVYANSRPIAIQRGDAHNCKLSVLFPLEREPSQCPIFFVVNDVVLYISTHYNAGVS